MTELIKTEKKKLIENMLSRAGDLSFRRRVLVLLDFLELKSGQKILDCGCGEGFYTMLLSNLGDFQITAFDLQAELLEKAAMWLRNQKNVTFRNGDIAEGLPFEDGSFDRIIFSEVLEHLDDDTGALIELRRVLVRGGILAVSVPNRNYPFFWDPLNWTRGHLGLGHFNPGNMILGGIWSRDHRRLYEVSDIENLTRRSGFEVLETRIITHYCVPFNYLILHLGKRLSMKLPLPRKTKRAMEKFEWKSASEKESAFSILKIIFDVFKWVDKRNDAIDDREKSSVSIALKLRKT